MAHDSYPGRSPYQSPDAVLAEARRIAADIRRRAEREASAVRRDAAEWASSTRREAERHRERVLAELEHAMETAEPPPAPEPHEPEVAAGSTADVDDEVPGEGLHAGDDAQDFDDEGPSAPVIDLRSAAEARGTPMPMTGRTYVVGHAPPPVETSIETKVHDVVRSTVRRTFNRRFS